MKNTTKLCIHRPTPKSKMCLITIIHRELKSGEISACLSMEIEHSKLIQLLEALHTNRDADL